MAEQIGRKAVGLFVIALLLFPGSSSVLCIAPGSHIAIEDSSALCCVSSGSFLPSAGRPSPYDELERPCDGKNCTDLFLALNGEGVLSQSVNCGAAGGSCVKCMGTGLSTDAPGSPSRLGKAGGADVQAPVCSAVPLRC